MFMGRGRLVVRWTWRDSRQAVPGLHGTNAHSEEKPGQAGGRFFGGSLFLRTAFLEDRWVESVSGSSRSEAPPARQSIAQGEALGLRRKIQRAPTGRHDQPAGSALSALYRLPRKPRAIALGFRLFAPSVLTLPHPNAPSVTATTHEKPAQEDARTFRQDPARLNFAGNTVNYRPQVQQFATAQVRPLRGAFAVDVPECEVQRSGEREACEDRRCSQTRRRTRPRKHPPKATRRPLRLRRRQGQARECQQRGRPCREGGWVMERT